MTDYLHFCFKEQKKVSVMSRIGFNSLKNKRSRCLNFCCFRNLDIVQKSINKKKDHMFFRVYCKIHGCIFMMY